MRAFLALLIVALVLLASACENDDPRTPAPPRQALPDPFVATPAAGNVLCPTPVALERDGTAVGDFGEFVYFNGVLYRGFSTFTNEVEQRVPPEHIGPEYARVAVRLGMSPPSSGYALRSCDASYQEPGTVFHRIEGHNPAFAITRAAGVPYFSVSALAATTAADLFDIEGKVAALDVHWEDAGQLRTVRITDQPVIARLVEMFLASPIERADDCCRPAGQLSHITFVLDDGLLVVRDLRNPGGNFRGSIRLGDDFESALREAADIQPSPSPSP